MNQANEGTYDADGVPVDDWAGGQACQWRDRGRGMGERGFHADVNALNAIELHYIGGRELMQLSCNLRSLTALEVTAAMTISAACDGNPIQTG